MGICRRKWTGPGRYRRVSRRRRALVIPHAAVTPAASTRMAFRSDQPAEARARPMAC